MSFLYGLGATLGTGIGIIFVMLCYYACKDLCEQHEAEKRLEKLRLLDKIRSWNQTQQTRGATMENDNVNHPKHYEALFFMKELECIDLTSLMSFNVGNAFKYVWRYGLKGDSEKAKEDLNKAVWYLGQCYSTPCNFPNHDVLTKLWEFVVVPEEIGSIRRKKYDILTAIIYGEFRFATDEIIKLTKEQSGMNR